MIRYVINEHWPYYAYDEFERQKPPLSLVSKKLGRLYFRLANFRQPSAVLNYPDVGIYGGFFLRGCGKSVVRAVDKTYFSDVENKKSPVVDGPGSSSVVELLRISPADGFLDFFEAALGHVDEHSVIIVEDIHKNKAMRDFWKKIECDERVVITFDLYYCGIIFFEKRRYKENYIVNF